MSLEFLMKRLQEKTEILNKRLEEGKTPPTEEEMEELKNDVSELFNSMMVDINKFNNILNKK